MNNFISPMITFVVLAVKSVKQSYNPTTDILQLMHTFRMMVNDCIRVSLRNNNVSTLKKLVMLSYAELSRYDILTYYKLCAISKVAGIMANRKKSMKRGIHTKDPYMQKPCLVSCYGFKIVDGKLQVPLGQRQYFEITLNNHTRQILPDPALKVRSFTLTANTVSICYSKEVAEKACIKAARIDRNLRNVTYGNFKKIIDHNVCKAVDIAENTMQIIASFKRNDARIQKKIASKYGKRRRNRIDQLLHHVSKDIVREALENKEVIVFEKLTGLRKLYGRGNGQGRKYRHMMNSFPFHEMERQGTMERYTSHPCRSKRFKSLLPEMREANPIGQERRYGTP